MVESGGMSGEGEREVWKVVCVNLRFVCASAHDPFSIFTDSYARASFLELEVLEKLHSICVLRIVFQAALPFARKPVGKWSRSGCARYRVDGHIIWVGKLHNEVLCFSE